MTIKKALQESTISRLENRKMDNPFKVYKPLDRGNDKLDSSILSFSLVPVNTCNGACKGCYDLKSFRYESVCLKRKYNLHMVINERYNLETMIIKQIKNSRTVKAVRIHVGGDFNLKAYTAQYIDMWKNITIAIRSIKPGVKFYTYTKTDKTETLKSFGINVVKSIRDDGNYNFDTLENLQEYQILNPEWFICPVYKENPNYDNVKCGKTCKACQITERILFVKH